MTSSAGTAIHLSVVIPTWQTRDLIEDQLHAVARELASVEIASEVIVVDDHSVDGTADAVEDWIKANDAATFSIVRRTQRGGPNASRNTGLQHATGRYTLFTDGDDVLLPGAVSAMLEAFRPRCLLAGRAVIRGEATPRFETTEPPRFCGVLFAPGSIMAGEREVFVGTGGFDENIMVGGSETEFAIRAQSQHQVEVVFVPFAQVEYRTPVDPTGRFVKNFKRERGYAYVCRLHRDMLDDPGWRTGVSQIVRGLKMELFRLRHQDGDRGWALVGAGAGRVAGRLVWRPWEFVRRREPRLFRLEASTDPRGS